MMRPPMRWQPITTFVFCPLRGCGIKSETWLGQCLIAEPIRNCNVFYAGAFSRFCVDAVDLCCPVCGCAAEVAGTLVDPLRPRSNAMGIVVSPWAAPASLLTVNFQTRSCLVQFPERSQTPAFS